MKNRVIAAVTNILICAVIAATALVGFYGGSAVTVSEHDENVFYSSRAQDAVSLMFLADGSGEDTDGVLDALKNSGAKATFFIKGSWADDNTSTVRKIYSSGCEVATAGYFADDYSTLSFDSTVEDISPSVSFLKVSCGAEVSLFMPTGLSFCENTVRACSVLGLKLIMCGKNVCGYDDAEEIFARATENLQAGDFILLSPTRAAAEALPLIINYIEKCGFAACTVSEALSR